MAQMDAVVKPVGWRLTVSTEGIAGNPSMLQIYFVYEGDRDKAVKLLREIAGLSYNCGISGYRANLHEFIASNMNPGDVKQVR